MDFNMMTLFSAVKTRMNWLGERQKVLAQNIANADTPGYEARDLKALDFSRLIRRQQNSIRMMVSNPSHIPDPRRGGGKYAVSETQKPYETAPAGNNVILEEQMMKINKTSVSHKLVNELYKKHLGMLRVALGKK